MQIDGTLGSHQPLMGRHLKIQPSHDPRLQIQTITVTQIVTFRMRMANRRKY